MSEQGNKKFSGKVALVTGATSGIGKETARAFAKAGAKVVVAGRREMEGHGVVEEIQQSDGAAIFVKADVTREGDVRNLIERTVSTFERLDFAFNNAGTEGTPSPISKVTEEDFDLTMNINVKGTFFSLKYEIPQMLRQGGGAIVNTSSVLGLVGIPDSAVYAASKHAILGLTKCVALEVAKQNIRVNAVLPAAIETEMLERFVGGNVDAKEAFAAAHPIGRVGRPQEIANAVLWLCSDESSFVVGQSLTVDGGYTAQ